MTRTPPPQHGERRCYLRGCRRPECLQAHYRYMSRYRLDRQRGAVRRVPAGPVTQHIRELCRAGLTTGQIAALAGCATHTVSDLLAAKNPTVRSDVAARILAAEPVIDRLPATTFIDPTGTLRRIHALIAIGHPVKDIARGVGMAPSALSNTLNGRYTQTTVATAQAVKNLYAAWSQRPGSSQRSRNTAVRRGWAPPAAWDDDTIDDPTAHPEWTGVCGTDRGYWIHTLQNIPGCERCTAAHEEWLQQHAHLDGRTRAQELFKQRAAASTREAAIAEDARELMRVCGLDTEQAAERLGVTRSHLHQALVRHRDLEVAA